MQNKNCQKSRHFFYKKKQKNLCQGLEEFFKMVWPFDYLFGWTKEEIVEAQNDIASVDQDEGMAVKMQAARTIQFAWKKYINAKKEAKDEEEKYFFDRRILSEAAKKKDEEDKNYFDKIISEEEEIVEAQHDIASVDQDEGLAMMLDSDESDEENEAKDEKDETGMYINFKEFNRFFKEFTLYF